MITYIIQNYLSIIIVILTIFVLTYWFKRDKNLQKNLEELKESGKSVYKFPLWERILQLFLILGTAFYALWQFGIKRLIIEEIQKGGDPRPLIATIVLGTLIIFGYYLLLIFSNRQKIEAGLSEGGPSQRYLSYLKIILIWIAVVLIDLFI